MEVTLNLEPGAVQVAQELAAERHQSVADFVSGAILSQRVEAPRRDIRVETDDLGFPVIHTSGTVTSEEIRAMRDEDETWEITRGDPYHPFHKPILTTDEQGFPQVDIGRPLTLEEVRAAVE